MNEKEEGRADLRLTIVQVLETLGKREDHNEVLLNTISLKVSTWAVVFEKAHKLIFVKTLVRIFP